MPKSLPAEYKVRTLTFDLQVNPVSRLLLVWKDGRALEIFAMVLVGGGVAEPRLSLPGSPCQAFVGCLGLAPWDVPTKSGWVQRAGVLGGARHLGEISFRQQPRVAQLKGVWGVWKQKGGRE